MDDKEKYVLDEALAVLQNLSKRAFGEPLSSSLVDDIKSDTKHGSGWADEYNDHDDFPECCDKCCGGEECGGDEDDYAEENNAMGGALGSSGFNLIADEIHNIAKTKGWWADATDPDSDIFTTSQEHLDLDRCLIAEKLLMIHSEISEATEELREAESFYDLSAVDFMDPDDSCKPTGFAVELADAIIRLLDLSAFLGIDIEEALAEKIAFNRSRPYRHGGKRL